MLALAGAAAAVAHGLGSLPSNLRPRSLPDLGIDAALGFWAVGAAFVVVDRLGTSTGFSPAIVPLTAVHFHFAGFGLLGLVCLRAAVLPRLRLAVAGLIAGIPLTAIGFMVASDAVNALGALLVGLSGIGAGVALLVAPPSGPVAWLSRVAGLALLVGMPMGIAWSLAILAGQTLLDLDLMIRTHGVLNGTAMVLAVIAHRPARSRSA